MLSESGAEAILNREIMSEQLFIFHATDYQNYPLGGTLGTIKNYLKYTVFEPVLIGFTHDPKEKIGIWKRIVIDGKEYDFLPVSRSLKEIVPHKILMPLGLLLFANKIMEKCDSKKLNAMIFINRECYPVIKYLLGRRRKVNTFYKMTEAVNPLKTSGRPVTRWKLIQSIYYHLFIKGLIQGASLIFGINEHCRRFCEEILKSEEQRRKIIDVNHYVDFDFLRSLYTGAAPVPKSAPTRMIYWGRLASVKGLDLMIKSVDCLVKTGKSVQLMIIGDGPERERLSELVKKLGIMNEVRFLGKRSIEEIAVLCKNADLFAMSSLSEGIPTAMLEAFTFGLPVVATSVGGIPTLVQDGVNGCLVTERDIEAYSAGIYKALLLDRKKAAEHSRSLVQDKFSARNVISQMDSLMLQMIEGSSDVQ